MIRLKPAITIDSPNNNWKFLQGNLMQHTVEKIGGTSMSDYPSVRDNIFQRGGDPYLALAYALKGVLGTAGEREKDLSDTLRTEPAQLQAYVAKLLDGWPPEAKLLIVIAVKFSNITAVRLRHRSWQRSTWRPADACRGCALG